MKIRYANHNDRKAVWFWLKDPMYQLFFTSKINIKYNKHCLWFDTLIDKKNLIIGVKDNLRIGIGIVSEITDKLMTKFYIKPKYCGLIGLEFITKSCEFIYEAKKREIYIDPLENTRIIEHLVNVGFSQTYPNLFLDSGPSILLKYDNQK